MKILSHDVVTAALRHRELDVLHAVQHAYVLHREGESAIPFSTFLKPAGRPGDRIISLPAYLGGRRPMAGVKWISSFRSNLDQGRQRASSVMILNDLTTGYPAAILEASVVSAWRTAASAALASHVVHETRLVPTIGLIGCGTINRATLTFLRLVHPELRTVIAYDAVPERARVFAEQLARQEPGLEVVVAGKPDSLLRQATTASIATTDSSYWLDLDAVPERPAGQVILHLSLRDLSAQSIVHAYNVVDDIDHVLREKTSLHRAEQALGHRGFIQATIGDLITGGEFLRDPQAPVVFSPFGLGILDLAVARIAIESAEDNHTALEVDGFDPGLHHVTSTLAGAHHV